MLTLNFYNWYSILNASEVFEGFLMQQQTHDIDGTR